jgi:hypothetical protein
MGRTFRRLAAGMVTVVALATLGASPASAVKPDIFKIPVNFSETFSDCGFDVVHTVVGFVTIHDFFDEIGNLTFEIATFSFTETFSNPANDTSIRTRDVGPDITTVSQDGSFTVATIGLITNIVVPGEGKLAGISGTIVSSFDAEGNFIDVIFVAGPHDDLLPAICDALA